MAAKNTASQFLDPPQAMQVGYVSVQKPSTQYSE